MFIKRWIIGRHNRLYLLLVPAIVFSAHLSLLAQSDLDPIVLDSDKETAVNLYVQNGCSNIYAVYSSNGNPTSSIPPTVGIQCNPFYSYNSYISIDTLFAETEIVASLEYLKWNFGMYSFMSTLYYVATDNNVYQYEILYNSWGQCDTIKMKRMDSLPISNIVKMKSCLICNLSSKIVSISNSSDTAVTNFHFRSSSFSPIFELKLPITPIDFGLNDDGVYVVGEDSNQANHLMIIDLDSQSVKSDLLLDSMTQNVVSVSVWDNSVYILSYPTDSSTVVTRISLIDSVQSSYVLYGQSICSAYSWSHDGRYLYSQPDYPSPIDMDMIVFNAESLLVVDTVPINRKAYAIQFPASASYTGEVLYIIEADNSGKSIGYIYDSNTYTFYDSLELAYYSRSVINEIRCFGALKDNLSNYIKFNTFPNPTSGLINLVISGVPCNNEHEASILDINGKVLYSENVKSKTSISFDFSLYDPGIYFIQMNINGELFSQKVIKQ